MASALQTDLENLQLTNYTSLVIITAVVYDYSNSSSHTFNICSDFSSRHHVFERDRTHLEQTLDYGVHTLRYRPFEPPQWLLS